MLDKIECKEFLREIVQVTVPERACNYDEDDFDSLFDKFDDDKNGYIEKSEMVQFLK